MLLHLPVHAPQPGPERLVAAGLFDVLGDPDGFQRPGGVIEDLGSVRQEAADQLPGLGT